MHFAFPSDLSLESISKAAVCRRILNPIIKRFANKGSHHWQAVAFTASYDKLWESSRPKSIFQTSGPTRYHTHSIWKQFIKSASAAEHKSTKFSGHVCSHAAMGFFPYGHWGLLCIYIFFQVASRGFGFPEAPLSFAPLICEKDFCCYCFVLSEVSVQKHMYLWTPAKPQASKKKK